MKKLALVFLLITTSVLSQNKFELTPEGFKANSENMIVIDVPNNNASTLFKKAKLHLTSLYKSYKNTASEVGDEMITINARELNAVRRNSMHVFDMNYTLTIRFKDDKIRFDAPTFQLTTFSTKPQTLHLVWTGLSLGGDDLGIYGKNDKLKSEKAKEDLEHYFNILISSIIEACKSDAQNDW